MSILVTGGSKGIGKGIALRFAVEGEHVFINYMHDHVSAKETAQEVERRGAHAHLVRGDIASADGIRDVVASVAIETDRLDQVVHCAVHAISAPALEIPADEFRRCVELNGSAILYLTQAVRPLLQRGSTLFILSSRGSKVAVHNYVGIGAPKALGESIVRYLAVELAPHGIRINIVSASALLTDAYRVAVPNAEEKFKASGLSNPSGRNLEVEDVANAVAFLASPEAEMITGREIFIDGGLYSKA